MKTPIVILILLAMSGIVNGQIETTCNADGDVQFVCGPQSPEDLIAIPQSPWVIASGRISDNDGYLYLTDIRDFTSTVLFPGIMVQEATSEIYSNCPGPTTLSFQPHGISLREGQNGQHTLYVVGHGEREAVEVFALDSSGNLPMLRWTGCIVAPEGVSLNSVAPLPGGAIVVTNFNVAGGELWEWQPGSGWSEVPGSTMSGPNGVVASADGRWLYIGGWGGEELVRLSRGRSPVEKDSVGVGFHIDNVRWAPDGTLLAAGQYGSEIASIGGCLRGGSCVGVASRVARIDPRDLSVEQLVDYPSNELLPFATVAIQINDEIWVGGIAGGTRIARFGY